MKRFLLLLTSATAFVACNTDPQKIKESHAVSASEQKTSALAQDTVGLAQYNLYKMQNELELPSQQEEVQEVAVKPVSTQKKAVKATVAKRASSAPVAKRSVATTASNSGTSSQGGSGTIGSSGSGDGAVVTADKPAEAEPAKEKEGWSNAAKGATIGAGGGAVIGAVIHKKNRAVGAAVGGVLGGAIGYGVGKVKDKKEGR